jgi:hypothetical protein
MANFTGARAKLTIGSLDDQTLAVEAQYNPKELQIDKPVNWSEKADAQLEFLGIQCRTFTVEMMFDCYEERAREIAPQIAMLEKLSSPREDGSRREAKQRPHLCIVLWGEAGMPRLRCVIDKLATKYVVWDEHGKPLRAICTVSLKETRLDPSELGKQGQQQIRSAADRTADRARRERAA